MGKDTEDRLAGSVIFGQLPQEERDEIVRGMESRSMARGAIIFKQGDAADKVYLIQSGRVRAFRKDSEGVETELAVLGPGESFGEMEVITEEMRHVNVEAMEETRLKVLSKEQFKRILNDFPDTALAFVKQISEWLVTAEKTIEKEAQEQRHARRISWLDFLLLIGASLVLAIVFNSSNPNGIPLLPNFPDRKAISLISAAQAKEEIKKGDTVIVDARPEGLYQRKHIQGATNVPFSLSDILYEVTFREEQKGKKVIVYGETFSELYDWELAEMLFRKGHKDVKVLRGGIPAWEQAGYPVDTWEEKK